MRKINNGFTLIELLVVISIIGLLSTVVMIGINIARSKARTVKCQHDLDVIYRSMAMMSGDTNFWPGGQTIDEVNLTAGNEICGDGCNFGLSSGAAGLLETDGSYPVWNGPYIGNLPLDPWSHEYFFDTDYRIAPDGLPCNGAAGCLDAAVIGSYGPDGAGNNQYNEDDIIKIIAQ